MNCATVAIKNKVPVTPAEDLPGGGILLSNVVNALTNMTKNHIPSSSPAYIFSSILWWKNLQHWHLSPPVKLGLYFPRLKAPMKQPPEIYSPAVFCSKGCTNSMLFNFLSYGFEPLHIIYISSARPTPKLFINVSDFIIHYENPF